MRRDIGIGTGNLKVAFGKMTAFSSISTALANEEMPLAPSELCTSVVNEIS